MLHFQRINKVLILGIIEVLFCGANEIVFRSAVNLLFCTHDTRLKPGSRHVFCKRPTAGFLSISQSSL